MSDSNDGPLGDRIGANSDPDVSDTAAQEGAQEAPQEVPAEQQQPDPTTTDITVSSDTGDTGVQASTAEFAVVPCDYRLNHNNCFARHVLGGFFIVPAIMWLLLLIHTFKALWVLFERKGGLTNDGLRNYRITLIAQVGCCLLWLGVLLAWAGIDLKEIVSDESVQALALFFGSATGMHFVAMTRHVVTYMHPTRHSNIANTIKRLYYPFCVFGLQTGLGLGYLVLYRNTGMGPQKYFWVWNSIMAIHAAVPTAFVLALFFSKAKDVPEPNKPEDNVDIDQPGELSTEKPINPRFAHVRGRLAILIGLVTYTTFLVLVPLQQRDLPDDIVLNIFMSILNFGLPPLGVFFVQRWTYQVVSMVPSDEMPAVPGPEDHTEQVHGTGTPSFYSSVHMPNAQAQSQPQQPPQTQPRPQYAGSVSPGQGPQFGYPPPQPAQHHYHPPPQPAQHYSYGVSAYPQGTPGPPPPYPPRPHSWA